MHRQEVKMEQLQEYSKEIVDRYLKSMGYDPQHIDRDKRMAFTKTIRFQQFAQRMGEEVEPKLSDKTLRVIEQHTRIHTKAMSLKKSVHVNKPQMPIKTEEVEISENKYDGFKSAPIDKTHVYKVHMSTNGGEFEHHPGDTYHSLDDAKRVANNMSKGGFGKKIKITKHARETLAGPKGKLPEEVELTETLKVGDDVAAQVNSASTVFGKVHRVGQTGVHIIVRGQKEPEFYPHKSVYPSSEYEKRNPNPYHEPQKKLKEAVSTKSNSYKLGWNHGTQDEFDDEHHNDDEYVKGFNDGSDHASSGKKGWGKSNPKTYKLKEEEVSEAMEFPQGDFDAKGTSAKVVGEKKISKSAQLIKSIYKQVKEDLYDHEKDDKDGTTYGKKPKMNISKEETPHADDKTQAAAVLSGGTTLTGQPRDTVEIDPLLKKSKPGSPQDSGDDKNNK